MSEPPRLVIDTNWLLDLWVFDDPRGFGLLAAIERREVRWLACEPMRHEFERVLGYPAVARRLQSRGREPVAVLEQFGRWAELVAPAPRAPWRCADPDDQIFVDLAFEWRATLLSKDAAVLALRRRLAGAGVSVQQNWT
ncbi:MAG: hypothetical protein RJA36_2956 [Pseudomonadota bacterium]|jgi:predicted nucleic acid-binding protein